MKRTYAVVFEWSGANSSAFVPDLPGCVSTGPTLADAKANILEAIEGHIKILTEFGDPIPEPTTLVANVEVAA